VRLLKVTSAAFEDNGRIPPRFTADGANISPPLAWSNIPPDAKSLALIVEDPDAQQPPSVHWLVYGIPPGVQGIPEGLPTRPELQNPITAVQGSNTRGTVGYAGPEPPRGHGTHKYHFRLYALDEPIQVEPGITRDQLMQLITSHVIATGEVIGTYER
jgi:Raf kinase inhibitor-like YbhB/YbcL family protein